MVSFLVNGKPTRLAKEFTSLELTDEVGLMADTLTIKVPPTYARPKGNDEIAVAIDGMDYGKFTVQETTKSDRALTIKARSANFASSLKEKKNRSWEKLKLCELVAKIAKEHKLKSKCNATLFVEHLAQHYESDIALLMRVAKKHHLHLAIKNNTILLLKQELEGGNLPLFVVEAKACISWKIKHSTRPVYGSCVAKWHDTKANQAKEVKVGKGAPVLHLEGRYKNEAEAREAAKAALANITQGSVDGSIELAGCEIRAGGKLQLVGFGEDDGIYTVKKVTHRIDRQGYRVGVEFEK